MAFTRLKVGDRVVINHSLTSMGGRRGTVTELTSSSRDDSGPLCCLDIDGCNGLAKRDCWFHHSRLIKLTPLDLLAEI